MSPFVAIYERIFAVLSADTEILKLAPKENIKPTGDMAQPSPGCMVVYQFRGNSSYSEKTKKGQGTIALFVESPKDKVQAHELLGLVRKQFTERILSDDHVRIALIKEQASLDEVAAEVPGAFRVQTDFDMKFAYSEA